MATLSCSGPSTGACSFISLQRQQHFTCHVECRVKSGCENSKHEAFEPLSVQSGLPSAKISSIILDRHGIDEVEAIPFSINMERERSQLFESDTHVENCLVPSQQNCLLKLSDSGNHQNANLLSIAIAEGKTAVKLNIKLHGITDNGSWDFGQDSHSKDLERDFLLEAGTSSVAIIEDGKTMDLRETDINGRLNDPIIEKPSTSSQAIHTKATGEESRKSQPPVFESLLGPLRCIKGWIANSLRRALMSLKYVKSSTRGSEVGVIDSNSFEVCESSSHLPPSTDGTVHTMSSNQENGVGDFPWEFLKNFLDNPSFVKFRVSISMANLTMTLSTFLCRALPILSDLKRKFYLKGFSVSMASTPFGSGVVLDTAISNLVFVISRLMMHLAIVWLVWSLRRVTRSMIGALQKHGAVERRAFNILVLAVEVAFGATAVFTILSSIAASSPSLAAPSFVVLALAGKDFFQNYFAGFFLLAVQPIQPGHIVSIPCYYKGREPIAAISWTDGECRSGWFEGVCESVGLTYTVLRNAQCQFRIPNSMFVRREFLVVDTSQDHVGEQQSLTKSVENFEIVKSAIDGTMKQSRLTKLPKDWRGRFGIGQHNSTSNGYKLHQVLAYSLPKLC